MGQSLPFMGASGKASGPASARRWVDVVRRSHPGCHVAYVLDQDTQLESYDGLDIHRHGPTASEMRLQKLEHLSDANHLLCPNLQAFRQQKAGR